MHKKYKHIIPQNKMTTTVKTGRTTATIPTCSDTTTELYADEGDTADTDTDTGVQNTDADEDTGLRLVTEAGSVARTTTTTTTNTQLSVPPTGYVCKLCHQPGHWLQQCSEYNEYKQQQQNQKNNKNKSKNHSNNNSKKNRDNATTTLSQNQLKQQQHQQQQQQQQQQQRQLIIKIPICKHWLKSKRCLYYDKGKCKFAHPEHSLPTTTTTHHDEEDGEDPYAHHATRHRSVGGRLQTRNDARVAQFRSFIASQMTTTTTSRSSTKVGRTLQECRVLDVAGGKGELAYQLLNLCNVHSCYVVDPRPLKLLRFQRRYHKGYYHRSQHIIQTDIVRG